MKRIILYITIIVLCAGCNRSEFEETDPKSQSVTQIRAHVATNRTRVGIDIDTNGKTDKAYWKAGDFLFVAEVTESTNYFTGHILKYNYVPPIPFDNQSNGTFEGIGMVTGGKYLVVNTNIPYVFIGLPQMGEKVFDCTLKKTFLCTAPFGDNPAEVQQVADQLLFIGTAKIPDSEADVSIALTSPMSMIEIHLTANNTSEKVEKIRIESEDAVFSYTIYADQSGECQSGAVMDNYSWEKLNSEVIFTAGHSQPLSETEPLKVRVVAFQQEGTKTSLTITATLDDDSTLSYVTPVQTQTLPPNCVTVINAKLESY